MRTIDVECPICKATPGMLCRGMTRGILASNIGWCGERVRRAGLDRELTNEERHGIDELEHGPQVKR